MSLTALHPSLRGLLPLAALLSLATVACTDKSGDDSGGGGGGSDDSGGGGDTEFTVEGLSGTLSNDDVPSSVSLGAISYTLSASTDLNSKELSGTMEWDVVQEEGGTETVLCDSTLALTGTALSGDCSGCDFAFDMSAEVVEDNGLSDCQYFPQYHYTEDSVVVNPRLVFFSEYSYTYYGYEYTYANLLRNGFGVDYASYGYGYYPGPYYTWIAFDGDGSPGSATLTDNGDGTQRLEWNWAYTYEYTESTYYGSCGGYPDNFDYTSSSAGGGTAHTSSLSCGADAFDVWEVELQAGDTFLATVDTVAADTAFDPFFFINGPDTCTLGVADEGFDCTFPPTDYTCPAAKLEVDATGTYQIVIGTYGFCTGSIGEYELQLGKLVPVE